MKKLYVFAMLLVVTAMVLAAFAPGELSTLSVWNKVPGETVNLKMAGIRYGVGYYLTAPGPTHRTGLGLPSSNGPWLLKSFFDIRKDIYDVTIYFCNANRSGTLNMVHAVRLVFPTCYTTVNSGEPGNEKVDLANAKPGTANYDQDIDPGDGIYPWGTHDPDEGSLANPNGSQIWWRLDWYNWWNLETDILEPFYP